MVLLLDVAEAENKKKKMKQLSQTHLKELLLYKPKTGVFIWKEGSQGRRKRYIAGCIGFYGYRQIKIEGIVYKASRLAFLYMTGYFPKEQADHKNHIRDDNRWANLRDISCAANLRSRERYGFKHILKLVS